MVIGVREVCHVEGGELGIGLGKSLTIFSIALCLGNGIFNETCLLLWPKALLGILFIIRAGSGSVAEVPLFSDIVFHPAVPGIQVFLSESCQLTLILGGGLLLELQVLSVLLMGNDMINVR